MVDRSSLPVGLASLYRSQKDFEAMMAYYDRQLSTITVPFQSQYIETRYATTHVLTAGNPANPALVMWHGMNTNATGTIPFMNAFADEFFFIAPDTPGDAGRSAPVRMDKKNTLVYGEWAADVLSALGVERAHSMGVSQGGWLTMQLAVVAPEKVISATLMSTAGFYPVSSTILLQVLPWMLFTPRRVAAARFIRIMGVPGEQPTEEEIGMFEALFGFKTENGTPPMKPEDIRTITAPTQVLMGEYERAFNPQQVIALAHELLPNLQHAEIIPGVSHAMSQRPDVIMERIRSFIYQYEPRL